MTPAKRAALMQQLADKWDSLPHASNAADAQAMLAYIKTVPGIGSEGVSADQTVWCTCADGQMLGFVNNEPDDDLYSLDGSTMSGTPAAQPKIQAPATVAKPAVNQLPSGQTVYLLNMFGPYENAVSDPRWTSSTPGLIPMLQTPGAYSIWPGSVLGSGLGTEDIAFLRTKIKSVSVLFTGAHGGIMNGKYALLSGQQIPFSSANSNPDAEGAPNLLTEALDPSLSADIANGRVVRMHAAYHVPGAGGSIGVTLKKEEQWHYAITASFVQLNWSFAPNSIWYNAACSGYQVTDMAAAASSKGLGEYWGWDEEVYRGNANNAARYLFDRLTGANLEMPQSPPNRPFDSGSTEDAMSALSPPLTESPASKATLHRKLYGTLQAVLLAPTIQYLWMDEPNATLHIYGDFGSTAGTVTINGQALPVSSWSASEIKCASMPTMGSSSSGVVQVTVNGHLSQKRWLTAWNANVTQTINWQGSQYQTAQYTARLRADVQTTRMAPDKSSVYLLDSGGIAPADTLYATYQTGVALSAGGSYLNPANKTTTTYALNGTPKPAWVYVNPTAGIQNGQLSFTFLPAFPNGIGNPPAMNLQGYLLLNNGTKISVTNQDGTSAGGGVVPIGSAPFTNRPDDFYLDSNYNLTTALVVTNQGYPGQSTVKVTAATSQNPPPTNAAR